MTTVPFERKPYIDQNVRILCVSYKYQDKTINCGDLGNKLKEYYERNSRNKVRIFLKYFTANVPHHSSNAEGAVEYFKKTYMKDYPDFTFYIHFCNPKISHTGNGHVITWASVTNTIHETGHLFKFTHANRFDYKDGKRVKLSSRDPFDCMTIMSPYPSLNPVHRHLNGWFLDNEEVFCVPGNTYNLFRMTNFEDKTNIKALVFETGEQRYWISYGRFKGEDFIIFHTWMGRQFSFLDHTYKVEKNKTFTDSSTGLTITINAYTSTSVELLIIL
jgi:hypothetical protein